MVRQSAQLLFVEGMGGVEKLRSCSSGGVKNVGLYTEPTDPWLQL